MQEHANRSQHCWHHLQRLAMVSVEEMYTQIVYVVLLSFPVDD